MPRTPTPDGSPNGAELANGTGIDDPDSDDDMFQDGVETNTGVWVSATDTGTDPLDDDSDDDTILDGVENHDLPFDAGNAATPGSDPNIWDTDGDLANDGYEIANGSDPTDPGSTAALPPISFRPGLVGGDLTDPEDDGIDVEDTAGTNFDWLGITASSEEYFTDATAGGSNEGAFDIFDNKVRAGASASGAALDHPRMRPSSSPSPSRLTHFTITSGNDSPNRDPRDWQILGSNDGVNFTPIFTRADDNADLDSAQPGRH